MHRGLAIAGRTRVIGLGNSVLSDDAVGLHVARRVRDALSAWGADIDVVDVEAGGFTLFDVLQGCERAILVDAILAVGLEPGAIVRFDVAALRGSRRLGSMHDLDLVAVLQMGGQLGYEMPTEVVVFGIQAADLTTFSEQLTPAVAAVVDDAVQQVIDEAAGH
ncbi:MAG: hydrogenase maturation protease [Myxococcota bacterium]